jgi:hypothetical protein
MKLFIALVWCVAVTCSSATLPSPSSTPASLVRSTLTSDDSITISSTSTIDKSALADDDSSNDTFPIEKDSIDSIDSIGTTIEPGSHNATDPIDLVDTTEVSDATHAPELDSAERHAHRSPTRPSPTLTPKLVVSSSSTLNPILPDKKLPEDADDEDDADGSSADDETNDSNNATSKEEQSLMKLQGFLQSTVESVLKSAMPSVIRSSYETNVSSQCTSAFLQVMRGLQAGQQWAFVSKSNFCAFF